MSLDESFDTDPYGASSKIGKQETSWGGKNTNQGARVLTAVVRATGSSVTTVVGGSIIGPCVVACEARDKRSVAVRQQASLSKPEKSRASTTSAGSEQNSG